jgi:hypothetical protein
MISESVASKHSLSVNPVPGQTRHPKVPPRAVSAAFANIARQIQTGAGK